MNNKNYYIKSDFLGGSVLLCDNTSYTEIEINVKIFGFIDSDSVIRVYFADRETKDLKSIGIIDNFGNLSKKADKNIVTDTIVFILKNTVTEKISIIGYAYFQDEWTLEDSSPIENAKKILDEIKSDKTNRNIDFDTVLKNITNENKENLKNYKAIKTEVLEEFDIYKITDFKPVSSISSVKYAMFEKNTIYSFDLFSHYLFGINKNNLLVAFASQNGINPILHLNDLCKKTIINNTEYFYVIIELSEDGQYFIKE